VVVTRSVVAGSVVAGGSVGPAEPVVAPAPVVDVSDGVGGRSTVDTELAVEVSVDVLDRSVGRPGMVAEVSVCGSSSAVTASPTSARMPISATPPTTSPALIAGSVGSRSGGSPVVARVPALP